LSGGKPQSLARRRPPTGDAGRAETAVEETQESDLFALDVGNLSYAPLVGNYLWIKSKYL